MAAIGWSDEESMLYSPYRILLAVVAAAAVACFLTIITATADPAGASTGIRAGKDERTIDRSIGPKCSERAWPYYEAHCLRDLRPQSARPSSIRFVTTERW
jgi:hypothetical protein